ncbi:MAG: hypothetical protein ACJAVI_001788 [Candidatus Azotimanducaceae bacterium]|jgi:hypothetical protein
MVFENDPKTGGALPSGACFVHRSAAIYLTKSCCEDPIENGLFAPRTHLPNRCQLPAQSA